jgi:hypothetical protein
MHQYHYSEEAMNFSVIRSCVVFPILAAMASVSFAADAPDAAYAAQRAADIEKRRSAFTISGVSEQNRMSGVSEQNATQATKISDIEKRRSAFTISGVSEQNRMSGVSEQIATQATRISDIEKRRSAFTISGVSEQNRMSGVSEQNATQATRISDIEKRRSATLVTKQKSQTALGKPSLSKNSSSDCGLVPSAWDCLPEVVVTGRRKHGDWSLEGMLWSDGMATFCEGSSCMNVEAPENGGGRGGNELGVIDKIALWSSGLNEHGASACTSEAATGVLGEETAKLVRNTTYNSPPEQRLAAAKAMIGASRARLELTQNLVSPIAGMDDRYAYAAQKGAIVNITYSDGAIEYFLWVLYAGDGELPEGQSRGASVPATAGKSQCPKDD